MPTQTSEQFFIFIFWQFINRGMKDENFYAAMLLFKLFNEVFLRDWKNLVMFTFVNGFDDKEKLSSCVKDANVSRVLPSKLFEERLNFFN